MKITRYDFLGLALGSSVAIALIGAITISTVSMVISQESIPNYPLWQARLSTSLFVTFIGSIFSILFFSIVLLDLLLDFLKQKHIR